MLDRCIILGEKLAIKVPGIPVDQHAAEVEHDDAASLLCHPCDLGASVCRDTITSGVRSSQSRAATSKLAAAEQGEPRSMPVSLGVSPIGWSNGDLPELGGDTPLDTCLAEARQAGFAGIELGHKFPRDPAVLRSILEGHRLALVSGWYSGRLLDRSVEEELAAIEAHRALLVALGCAVLVYAETSGGITGDCRRRLSSRPRLRDEEWPDFGGRLTDLADYLARGGIRLAYHHHMGTVVENEDEIDRLMGATGDSVGLLLDTGHLAF